ncbi:MAG: hypothetical protein ACI4WS_10195 [Oscillospiraceae bacterium]
MNSSPKKALLALLPAVILTGCALNTASAPAQPLSPEESAPKFPVVFTRHETTAGNTSASPDPVISSPNNEYYEYNGGKYWHDYDCFYGMFVEKDGKYTPVLNEDEDISYALENYPIVGVMTSFAAGDYQYIGRTKIDFGENVTNRFEFDDFYLRNNGEYMLHIYGLSEQDISVYPMLTEMLEDGGTAVCAEILTLSPEYPD